MAAPNLPPGFDFTDPDIYAHRLPVAEFAELPQVLSMPTPGHLSRALQLQPRVRGLDGLYVALAESLGCPLMTTDGRLARAGLPVEVRSPG